MADNIFNPEKSMRLLEQGVSEALMDTFPIEGRNNILRLKAVYVGEPKHSGDFRSQKKAKLYGRTWPTGIYGDFELVEKSTGKVIDQRKMKVINLPNITQDNSYIVGGNAYQVDNQWRLKSGVYARQKANGELETQFNLAKGRGFRMTFMPERKNFLLSYHTSNIPLVSALNVLGVSDDDMRKAWGNEVFSAAAAARKPRDLIKLAKSLSSSADPKTDEEAAEIIKQEYDKTELRASTTAITLGKPYDRVTGEALLAASTKLLNINRGTESVDNRDALQFKELWSVPELISERLVNSRRAITRKVKNNIDRKDSIRTILPPDTFNMPIGAFFTSTSIAQQATQVNPLEMLSGVTRTTVMGPGGISSANAISLDAKLIDSSHMGFLDPVATPEGEKTGITLHLGLGVSKQGKEAALRLYDTKTGTLRDVTAPELAGKVIGFPDQYTWKDGKPTPASKQVSAVTPDDQDPILTSPDKVDFVLPTAKAMFSLTANLIPFLASTQANRAEMATRHLEQAISLKGREQPLVQTVANPKKGQTWEDIVGEHSAIKSPVGGTVVGISAGEIQIKDSSGKIHTTQIYDNFPLNDKKSFLHSTPIVKKGDTVAAGQLIADNNFTKDGTLALGTNLRVGYLPYKGLVFEDGIVISESASEKLTSEHLYKERTYLESDMETNLRKFRANHPAAMTDENARKLDDDGVVRVGQTVDPGDILVAALRKSDPKKEQVMLRGIHRSLAKPFKNVAKTWDSGVSGVVTDVVKNGREIVVLVRTEEQADIGDKLCYSEDHDVLTSSGWVPVSEVTVGMLVASIAPDHSIEYVPVAATHAFPHKGQMYRVETAAVSTVVTPDHNMYVQKPNRDEWTLDKARNVRKSRYKLKTDGIATWGDVDAREFNIFLPKDMTTDAASVLMAMALSAGSIAYDEASCTATFRPPYTTKNYLGELSSRLVDGGVHNELEGASIRICAPASNTLVAFMEHVQAGYPLPIWIRSLSAKQSARFVDLVWVLTAGTAPGNRSFVTGSAAVADGLQIVCLHAGIAARVQAAAGPGGGVRYAVRRLDPSKDVQVNGSWKRKPAEFREGYVHYEGSVHCVTLERNHVLYVRRSGRCHWSGNSGRYGNKGVITAVIPDEEMPRDKDGNALEIVVNPSGVPGRINPSQVLETHLAKVADKTGGPLAVDNFQLNDGKKIVKVPGHYKRVVTKEGPKLIYVAPYEYERGYERVVAALMEENGVSPTEELFDPATGKSLGQVLVGKQYFLKLMHQVDKKLSARSHGYGQDYDASMIPKGGGKHGAQKFGGLGLFAMLAHGATANIRDGLTMKSDKTQEEVWDAIQSGERLPAPRPSFAYEKFISYLRAAGINVDKEGSGLILTPLTDEQVLDISNGELTDPTKVIRGKDLKPEKGGLFDEDVTGGLAGKNWSHIDIVERLPNPLFAKAIRSLLGLSVKEYSGVVAGDLEVVGNGEVRKGPRGLSSLVEALAAIDVDKELKEDMEALQSARKNKLNEINRRVKYLRALKENGLTADQAYTTSKLPVLPPQLRPITAMEGGDLNVDGLNKLYRDFAVLNETLRESSAILPDEELKAARADLYDALVALIGLGVSGQRGVSLDGKERPPGLLDVIAGTASPKHGFFQDKVVDRKQDLSMRSVIVPDLDLSLDEIGLPRKGAMQIFRPFVVRELTKMGMTPLRAREEIEKDSKIANKALDVVTSKRPVLFKRDPVLHKFGIMGFKARLHDELAVHIHPLVVGGFNADFDGDAQHGYVYLLVPTNEIRPGMSQFVVKDIHTEFSGDLLSLVSAHLPDLVPLKVGLHEVPHGELVASKDHIDFFLVDYRAYVISKAPSGYDLAEVTSWSRHKDREVWFVHTSGGSTIVTDDCQRAVMYMDPDSLEYRRVAPAQAKGLLVPSAPLVDAILPEEAQAAVDFITGCDVIVDPTRARATRRAPTLFTRVYQNLDSAVRDADAVRKLRPRVEPAVVNGERMFAVTLDPLPTYKLMKRERVMPTMFVGPERMVVREFLNGPPPTSSRSGNKLGYVPFPSDLSSAIMPLAFLRGNGPSALYSSVAKGRARGYIRAGLARKIIEQKVLPESLLKHPLWKRWVSIVSAGDTFDVVTHVENSGIRADLYDLTVPGWENFLLSSGLPVSNTMAVFVPVTDEAVQEAYDMMPSKNLFNPSTGKVMYQPSLEGQLGLFLMSSFGDVTDKEYTSDDSIIRAFRAGGITANDVVKLNGKETTAGRTLLAGAVPEEAGTESIRFDPEFVMNSKNLQKVLRSVAMKAPDKFRETADNLKDLGFGHSYNIGFSFNGGDFEALRDIRNKHLAIADETISKIAKGTPKDKRNAEIVAAYAKATKDMSVEAEAELKKRGSNLLAMNKAGVKPGWAQLQQLVIAPMLLENAKGNVIPVPVTRSYSEGVDASGYWVSSQGARKGLIEKVQSVSKPGALSKQIMNTTLGYTVTAQDCGTDEGISLESSDSDIVDRFLAKPVKTKSGDEFQAGTLITPKVQAKLHAGKVAKVVVRSPLRCRQGKGMCAKCYGQFSGGSPVKVGDNIGAIAGQSLGERAVQVSMKVFHTGGVAGSTGAVVSALDRVTELLKFPETLAGSAVLSTKTADVERIDASPAGGWDVTVGGVKHYVPGGRKLEVKKGDSIRRGTALSNGPINPRELLELTNINTVQRYVSDEIFKVFESEGVKKRNVEVVVKALTNLGMVEESDGSSGVLRGDVVPLSYVAALNKKLKKPIQVTPILRGIETLPLDQTTDWLARLQYRRLKETLSSGVNERWSSNIHGEHPIPGVTYSAEFGVNRDGGKY